ncbi:MAG: deoxynucleoside kinase [Thermodesulfobacteriota bacterium]
MRQIWFDDPNDRVKLKGIYIAVSGNSGSGKTTLINSVVNEFENDKLVIGVNERRLHHPLLKLMFFRPIEYAFVVQLHFMIMRFSVLYRLLQLGFTVIIERSHYDDIMFVEDHFSIGNISDEQFCIYKLLKNNLHKFLPEPDLHIFLEVTPKISLERIKAGELNGERPKEFPNEQNKFDCLSRWDKMYKEFYTTLLEEKNGGMRFQNTKIELYSEQMSTKQTVNKVVQTIKSIKERHYVQFQSD